MEEYGKGQLGVGGPKEQDGSHDFVIEIPPILEKERCFDCAVTAINLTFPTPPHVPQHELAILI